MVSALIDSTILVDLLRSYPPSLDWFAEQPRPGITPIVWVEILEGVVDLRAQKRAVEFLRHFERIDLEPQDFDWAFQKALQFKLSHSVGVMDCLIASVAYRLELPLYTCNLKHFAPILGTLAQKPY